MRVLYVNQTAQISGAEQSLLTLLRSLEDRVEELAACPAGDLSEALAAQGVDAVPIQGTQASFRLHPVHTPRSVLEMARSALEIRRLVARAKPDLVHANSTRAALLALLARDSSGPPVLAHIRDWVPEGRFSSFVLDLIARRADMVVANSRYVARQFDGMPLRRPAVAVHNPVDFGHFDPAKSDGAPIRAELALGEGVVILAVVAQITPWKGQDDAIRALADLAASGRDVVLLVVGSAKFGGPRTQFDNIGFDRDLHALAKSLGVEERVRFLGERSDIPDVLAATDVLLLPSWREAFGRIAVEAMALGVPVAATDVGGPAEIVRPKVDGLLLPPQQPTVWAEGLKPLVDDPALRASYGREAVERAGEFGMEAHADAVLKCYAELTAAA